MKKSALIYGIISAMYMCLFQVSAQTDLIVACEKGDVDAVRNCIARGDDVNFFIRHEHKKDECGQETHGETCNHNENRSPLFWAVLRGRYDIAELLLKNNADPNLTLTNNTTVLHWACIRGDADMVRLLLNYKASPLCKNDTGITPLMYACFYNDNDEIARILAENGADINDTDNNGKTANFYKKERIANHNH